MIFIRTLIIHFKEILAHLANFGTFCASKNRISFTIWLVFEKERKFGGEYRKKCCSRPNRMPLKCILYNLFNIFFIYCKAFWQSCVCSWDFSKNRRIMPETIATKSMKRGDHKFWSCRKVSCCKWFDNQTVIMLFNSVGGMTDNHINHSTIPKRISIKISSIIPRCY